MSFSCAKEVYCSSEALSEEDFVTVGQDEREHKLRGLVVRAQA